MRLAALCIAALLTGCASAPPPPATPSANCAVKISFGSYAMGVDQDLATRLQAAIASDARIAATDRRPWGREGEFDLCLTLRPGASARDVYLTLGAMLKGGDGRAPTSVSLPDGRIIRTPNPS